MPAQKSVLSVIAATVAAPNRTATSAAQRSAEPAT